VKNGKDTQVISQDRRLRFTNLSSGKVCLMDCVEEIWKRYKDIVFEGVERSVPHKILSKNLDPEYYNREVKRLKVKVRRVYNKRKFGEHYQEELKRLSKELLVANRRFRGLSYVRSNIKKVNAGQSSSSMLKDTKGLEKIFQRSKVLMIISS
jgi:hypothetical protein